MKLFFHIPKEKLLSTYRQIRSLLHGNDGLIFTAMARRTGSFTLPSNAGEYKDKHAEIEKILSFPDALSGRETAFNLMEDLGREVQSTGGVVGLSADDVIRAIRFEGSDGVVLRLTSDLRWAAEWTISVHQGAVIDQSTVVLDVHDHDWGEIVPTYVLRYVHGGILLYKLGMNAVSVALLAIAVESTLRDVLETKGYTFIKGASSVDIFGYSNATVDVDGPAYTVTFNSSMPKPTTAFTASSGGARVDIQVKRAIQPRDNTIYLKVLAPTWLIDHWSSDTPIQLAQKRVNGLWEAFHIAREVEGFLTPTMLPTDFDEVITVVRNNLIHLSGQALETPLHKLDPSGAFTLGQFLEDHFKVYDLVANVPRFINDQYIALRKAGHLVP